MYDRMAPVVALPYKSDWKDFRIVFLRTNRLLANSIFQTNHERTWKKQSRKNEVKFWKVIIRTNFYFKSRLNSKQGKKITEIS